MNPLLLDIPQEISTERLLLRMPRAGDGAIIFPAARESLAELKPWMPWATDDYSVEKGEEWCRRGAARFLLREELPFLMFLREGLYLEGLHLGNIGMPRINWELRKCEIGYWLRTSQTGRGYMTEAGRAMVELLLKLGFCRIEIRCDPQNQKSRAVAQRLGFQLEGILRSDSLSPGGERRDTCVFGLIRAGT
jgi:RimJ/RimL family protein N-acetyltransferase